MKFITNKGAMMANEFDDENVLDILDSNEKAFGSDTVEKPKYNSSGNWSNNAGNGYNSGNKGQWNNGGNKGQWKPKGNGYNYGDRPKQPNLWDKKDFEPVKIDVTKLTKSKSFVIGYPNGVEIGDEHSKALVAIAGMLGKKGYTFRYSGSNTDKVQNAIRDSFLELAETDPSATYKIETYLPWPKFNEDIESPTISRPTEAAYCRAVNLHTAYYDQKPAVRAILAKDIHACLGTECDNSVKFMIIYTPCGSEMIAPKADFKKLGTTSFFLKIAAQANINVFNIKNPEAIRRLSDFLKNEEALKEVNGEA